MRTTLVDLASFDLPAFIVDVLRFVREIAPGIDPAYFVLTVRRGDGIPCWADEPARRNLLTELTQEEQTLFFPFSGPNLGKPIPCADGRRYRPGDDDRLGPTDFVGFLVSVEGDEVTLRPAVYVETPVRNLPPTTRPLAENSPFAAPMTRFVSRFIRR